MLNIQPSPTPLRAAEDNETIYVGDTTVPLEYVLFAYKNGESPEEIVESFVALNLADVYAAIAYYLYNTAAVEEYLAAYKANWEAKRLEIEAAPNYKKLDFEVLAARRKGTK